MIADSCEGIYTAHYGERLGTTMRVEDSMDIFFQIPGESDKIDGMWVWMILPRGWRRKDENLDQES